MIGEKFGRFRITAPLGKGGMASVWRAEDPLLGRDVAIKVIAEDLARSPGARARFRVEAENGRKLDHPGIVPVIDYAGSDAEHLWIAFGLVEGDTLADRVARAPMDPREAARIVADAAEAIAHAHERGVLHRDVSTRNIMVGGDDRVFVLDFGLSRALDQESFTSSGVLMGTPHFLAPEVVRGERATESTDVWGLGVALYEALTGRLPFRHPQREALLHAIVNEIAETPSRARAELGGAWDDLLAQVLAKDPRGRPRADSLERRLRELQEVAAVQPVATAGAGPVAREVTHLFVAVFPFTADDAAVGRGLAGAICSALTSAAGVTVIPADVAAANKSLESTARSLGANRVLSGEVRRNGTQVRVTWRVVDPFTHVQVAGTSIDGMSTDPFTLEDRIVEGVVRALRTTPTSTALTKPRRDPAARERLQQARSYLQRHDHAPSVDGAISILERLVESEGESAEVLGTLGRAYLFRRRLSHERAWESRAASACERAMMLDPLRPDVQLTLAEIQFEAGRLEESLLAVDSVLERDPGIDAWIVKGRTLESMGRLAEAEVAFRSGTSANPEAWNGHQWLGLFLFHVGRYDEAIEEWKEGLRFSPENPRTLANLGAAHFQLGQFDQAIAACRRSIRAEPNARAFSNLGTALFASEQYAESLEAFQKASALNPADPLIWGQLGSAARLLPDHEAEARSALERAVALCRDRLSRNASDALLESFMAGWLSNLGQFDQAREAIEHALSLAPEDVSVMTNAIGALQARWPEKAIFWLKRAIDRGYGVETCMRDPALATLRETASFREFVRAHRRDASSGGGR